jgi:hypothetical protein
MRGLKKLDDVLLSTPQLSALLGISAQYVGRLRQQGVIEQVAPGKWLMLPTVPRAIERMRNDRRRDDSGAMAKLRAAQVERLEIQNAVRMKELIPFADSELALDIFAASMFEQLNGLPARIARGDLALQRRVEQEVFEARERTAARLGQVIEATKRGEDPSQVFGLHGDSHGA